MTLIRKKNKFLASKKFSDGNIVTIEFGTEIEEDNINEDDLGKAVIASTKKDMHRAYKADPMVKVILDSMQVSVRKEQKIIEAEQKLKAIEKEKKTIKKS